MSATQKVLWWPRWLAKKSAPPPIVTNVFVIEKYLNNFSPGAAPVSYTVPDLSPYADYQATIGKIVFSLSALGPAPTVTKITLWAGDGGPQPYAVVTAPTDISAVNATTSVTVPLLASAQGLIYTRKDATGYAPAIGIAIDVAPGNAAANPVMKFSVTFNVI